MKECQVTWCMREGPRECFMMMNGNTAIELAMGSIQQWLTMTYNELQERHEFSNLVMVVIYTKLIASALHVTQRL